MSKDVPNIPQGEDPEFRIEKLKREVEELTGGKMISNVSEDCPLEIEEKFWEHVLAYERAKFEVPFEMLVKGGMSLPSPRDLSDTQLTLKLWEVIRGLALLGAYLECTDHLSDRELYTVLWSDLLREETMLLPNDPDFACHLDPIGSGSEKENFIYLKYYADEEYRRHWAREWPDDPLPEHEPLPFDRDRHLPKPAFENWSPSAGDEVGV
jgi:hypothetical protein